MLLLFSFYLTLIAVLCIGYLVLQLGDTNGEPRPFRILFPPRRQRTVPWGVSVIVPVLLIYVLMVSLSAWLVVQVFPTSSTFPHDDNVAVENMVDSEPDAVLIKPFSDEDLAKAHPLTILMQKSRRDPMVILICFLMAVIVAPLTEEFLFRVVIQGGIEATLRRGYGHSAMAKRIPILFTALFFAAIHFRTEQKVDQSSIDRLFLAMIANMIGNLATVVVVIVIFRKLFRIRWSDIGLWDARRIGRDALGALLLLLAILIPIGIVSTAVTALANTQWAANLGVTSSMVDPIPLFLFALVIGTLYYRTRRFAAAFFLHALFNLFSFLMLLSMVA